MPDYNIYYSPEHFGLTVVGELDDDNACYSFDKLVVWSNAEGKLLYATDAGCSCPSPFENHTLDDLIPVSFPDFECFVHNGNDTWGAMQRLDLIDKVRRLLRNA